MESAPGIEAGKLRDGAAGEGVDVDGVPHPRQVRHAVRGHLFLALPRHGHHQGPNPRSGNCDKFEERPKPARSSGDERRRARALGRECCDGEDSFAAAAVWRRRCGKTRAR